MKAILNNNKIEIRFKYDHALVSLIKSFDGRQYSPTTKSWFVPVQGARTVLEKLARQGFDVEPAVVAAVKEDEQTAQEAESLAILSDTSFDTPLPLYPFQRVGVNFLYKIGSGILGDSPGTGKTLMMIAVAEKNNADKILVFCPAVLKHQWANELNKFIPHRKVIVLEGDKNTRLRLWREDAHYYIVNYEQLLRDFNEMNSRCWDYIFADECTKISNPRAKQSKAIRKLRAKNRIAATGTPISNRADELWNPLTFCNPGCVGDYWNFINRYCLKNRFGGIFGYQNLEELKKKIKRYMIRRTKEEVLPELPEKIETDIPFVLSDEESELQTKIKKELLFEINKMDINKLENPMTIAYTLTKFIRLRQLADSLELLGNNKKSSKLEVLKELLEEFKGTDQKILIFSEFAEMCKILHRELKEYQPAMIIGETNDKKRQKVLEKFERELEGKILILSSAGMYGLNLQVANVVINYDLPFSLARLEQRIGRAYRMHQKKTVLVYNLLGKGTADTAIKKIIYRKSQLSKELLGVPVTMQDIQSMILFNEQ